MSDALQPVGGHDVAVFDPVKTREKLAHLDGDIVTFRQLQDWPKLAEAAAAKIKEQTLFLKWWDDTVRDKGERANVAAAGHFVADVETQTGITKQIASRWRGWLKKPDKYHERIMRGSLRAAGLIEDVAGEYHPPVVPDGQYGTIVIDPPWDMQKIVREVRPNQVGFDYPTMSDEELLAWPVVRDLAGDDCHLFCWTTEKWLPFASTELMEAWGFNYLLTMVWHKPGGFQPVGLPQYNCEFVIYARKGAPKFLDTKDFFCCFEAPRREHSRKPDEFYDLVRRVTPGPHIDIFSREPRDGFAQFGNETGKFAA